MKREIATITVTKAIDEDGYYYDIYIGQDVIDHENEPDPDDGGLCTTTLLNGLEMAYLQAVELIKNRENDKNSSRS